MNDIIPDKHENKSRYNTRNKHNYFIPRCRLELFKKSFVPDSIRLWNLLKAEAREAISINSFRKNISVEIENPPSYYAFGKRFINIIHTKLRHKCTYVIMIFINEISQILHFVHAVTMKTRGVARVVLMWTLKTRQGVKGPP